MGFCNFLLLFSEFKFLISMYHGLDRIINFEEVFK